MATYSLDAIKIAGVGDCTLDHLFRSPAVSGGGAVRVSDYASEGGGLTATALVACARLGCRAELVCRLGCDGIADTIIHGLVSSGVATDRIVKVPDCRSPVSFVQVDQDSGERTISYYRDPLLDQRAPVPQKWDLVGVACLLVDDTWLAAAISAARAARELGIPVIADLIPLEANRELVSVVDTVITSSHYGDCYAKNGDYTPALREIQRMGPRMAAITVGRSGSWFADGAAVGRVGAFEVKVIDTTGAGDVFHGAFACAAAMGWAMERRIEFASAVSALKCRKMGGRAGIPSYDETLAFLRARGRLDWTDP